MIEALINSQWWDVDVEVLKTLPLNDPQATLALLDTLQKENRADYQQIDITRKGCSVSS